MRMIIDYAERILLIILVMPFIISFVRYFPSSPFSILLMVSEGLVVVLSVIRRPGDIPVKAYPMLIGVVGTVLPLLVRPGPAVAIVPEAIATAIMALGLVVNIGAKLSLNRSFGMVAANRGIKRGGAYRLVRHPMYLGYIVTEVGFLLSAFTLHTLLIYVGAWVLLVLRIIEEEKLLMQDPAYQAYAETVRRRLVPGF